MDTFVLNIYHACFKFYYDTFTEHQLNYAKYGQTY